MSIIYVNSDGVVSVVQPTLVAMERYTIEEIAAKSIPLDVPFWIVEDDFIPSDRSFRNLWGLHTESMGEPSGYGEQQ